MPIVNKIRILGKVTSKSIGDAVAKTILRIGIVIFCSKNRRWCSSKSHCCGCSRQNASVTGCQKSRKKTKSLRIKRKQIRVKHMVDI